jgi:hypothetical protein
MKARLLCLNAAAAMDAGGNKVRFDLGQSDSILFYSIVSVLHTEIAITLIIPPSSFLVSPSNV